MKIIQSKDIIGKPTSDLIPNNIIERADFSEDKVSIVYSHTSGGEISAHSDETMFASNKIYASSPHADYAGEIVSGTSVGRVAFYNFITPKNTKYYHVVQDMEPYGAIYDASNDSYIGGEFNYYESYADFKSSVLGSLSTYFTHELGYFETPKNPYNGALSKINLVGAVRIDEYREYQLLVGSSADLYSINRESFSNSKGAGKKLFSIESNELFQVDTKIGTNSIGNVIADEILSKYAKGKQTITLTVVIRDDLYIVGETVIPYGFDGQPMARKADGTAKQFMITSAEFVYRGSYRQNLEMVEII